METWSGTESGCKNMRDYKTFLNQLERVIHEYNQRENCTQNYGVDVPLTQTEMHMIAVIGEQPGIGVKALAQMKGVTPGAASQMIKKLVQKGLVTKQISPESEAKIELTLTEMGQFCFLEHQKVHEEANQKWYQLLDQVDDQTYNAITQLVKQAEKLLK